MIRLGAQLSQARGFETAIREAGDAGLRCLQVFSRNPVGGQGRDLPPAGSLKPLMDQMGVESLFVHAPYFVNPASVETDKKARACAALKKEMRRAKRLSAQYVVLHPGHWPKDGNREAAVQAFAGTIGTMLSAPGRILIENSAGQGREVGADWQELEQIFSLVGKTRRVGLMLDTAHAMGAGHRLSSRADAHRLLDVVDQHIGLSRLVAIHLNDTRYPVGSRRDHHAHLLEGSLGRAALAEIVAWAKLQDCFLVLETPGRDVASRRQDIEIVRSLASSG